MAVNSNDQVKYATSAKIAAVVASLLILTIRIRFGAVVIAVIAIVASVFALYGLYEIRRHAPKLKGKGLCVYALILSSVAYVIFAWVIGDKLIVTQQEAVYEELLEINKQLIEYKNKNKCWPITAIGLSFMHPPPKDPWGREYQYQYTGDCIDDDRSENYTIYTLGKDGVKGGENENADLAYKSNNYRLYVNGIPTTP